MERAVAQSFTELMPKLKASEYDYIVFDLPPLTETSGSIRLAGQMERTLLVVESEKTAKDSLLQGQAISWSVPDALGGCAQQDQEIRSEDSVQGKLECLGLPLGMPSWFIERLPTESLFPCPAICKRAQEW
jgi:hypothetical protein